MEDQLELESLVAYHLRFLPPGIAIETRTTWGFLTGRLDPYKNAELLLALRFRKNQLAFARHIVEGLG